jgi:hypothetical protein
MDKTELKIFHIAGITDLYKNELIEKLKKLKMFVIHDLDIETEKIYKNKEIQTKIKELEKLKSLKKKKLEAEISSYWQDKLDECINKSIKENQNSYALIFIGNTAYSSISSNSGNTLNIRHMKCKVLIKADNKFFLKVNLKDNAQEIIKFNLKKYHDDIVNGEFPLDYINLEYLINSRETLQEGYKKLNYNIVPLDKIYSFFESGINEKKPELLYVVLSEEYTKDILCKKKVYAFTEDWIALSSIVTGIERGYIDGMPYVKEKTKGAFKKLQIPCYIYVVQSTNFLSDNNSKFHQNANKKIKIIKSMHIENIYGKLKEMKIKFN